MGVEEQAKFDALKRVCRNGEVLVWEERTDLWYVKLDGIPYAGITLLEALQNAHNHRVRP